MDESAKKLSYAVDSMARAAAEWTVARHLEKDPILCSRYGSDGRKAWVQAVQAHLGYLAQAVAVRNPDLFVSMIHWEADAYRAQGAAVEDLRISLECLREVLLGELPSWVHKVIPYLDAAITKLGRNGASPATTSACTLAPVAVRYLEAVLSCRGSEAIEIIVDELRRGLSLKDVYLNVLSAAMSQVGRMWHDGEITVAEEHLASAVTHQTLVALRQHWPAPPSRGGTRAVAAALSGDYHEIGLRMAADLLEMEGWLVDYVGVNTPTRDLLDFLERQPARLLLLSVGSCMQLRNAGEMIELLHAAFSREGPRVLVGGAPFLMFPELWQELGADGCARTLADVVSAGQSLVA